jgi:hypothetical protein
MLSADEKRVVASRLSSCDHDHFWLAGLAGEPFLRHGLLCYFDAVTVEIVGFPLDSSHTDAELSCRAHEVMSQWAEDPSVKFINYYGPVRPSEPAGTDWASVYQEDPVEWNLDVFIDLTLPIVQRKKVRQDVRRARNRGIDIHVCQRESLGHEHIRLMTGLVERAAMNVADASSLTNLVSILRDETTFVFEARHGDRLVGFAVAHQYFAPIAMVVGAAFDRSCTGSADVTYAAMLQHFRDRSFSRIGLGYATDENLFRYKTKWGSPIVGRPFFQRTWCRVPELGFLECHYWPWRLMRTSTEGRCLRMTESVPADAGAVEAREALVE